MKVALDIDGVIRDFDRMVEKKLRQEGRIKGRIKKKTVWDLGERYGINGVDKFIFQEHPEVFEEASMYPRALEFIKQLVKNKHEVGLLTSQPPHVRKYTKRWIEQNIPQKYLKFVIMVANGNNKVKHPFDVLLDDKPETIALANSLGRKAFLMTRPWNASEKLPRARSYAHFLKILNKLESKK